MKAVTVLGQLPLPNQGLPLPDRKGLSLHNLAVSPWRRDERLNTSWGGWGNDEVPSAIIKRPLLAVPTCHAFLYSL